MTINRIPANYVVCEDSPADPALHSAIKAKEQRLNFFNQALKFKESLIKMQIHCIITTELTALLESSLQQTDVAN